MFQDEHLQPSTISTYFSGMKSDFLASGLSSAALGTRGVLHELVNAAFRSLSKDTATVAPRPRRAAYSVDLLEQGRKLWPIDIFAMSYLVRAFILRSGELLKQDRGFSPHVLHWSEVRFRDSLGAVIPPAQWTSRLAHWAAIFPASRKHQPAGRVRELPEHVREFFPSSASIVAGLLDPGNPGCAVAILQGYFVYSNAATRSLLSPICLRANESAITAAEVLAALRSVQLPDGVDPRSITIHSLKHDATSTLIDSGLSDEAGRQAAGFASVDTLKTYDHCRPQLGAQISKAMLWGESEEK
jgi:hypothetical protein